MSAPAPTDSESEHFLLDVIYTIPTAKMPSFLDAFQEAYDGVIKEERNTLFELSYREVEGGETTEIHLVEAWEATTEWFMAVQIKKEYYKSYFEITEPMHSKERKVGIWKRLPKYSHSKPSHFSA